MTHTPTNQTPAPNAQHTDHNHHPPHPAPRLFQELNDIIIDFCHTSPPTLSSCSLVCRTWLPSTRFHLFRDLKLQSRTSSALIRLLAAAQGAGVESQTAPTRWASKMEIKYDDSIRNTWLDQVLPPLIGAGVQGVTALTVSHCTTSGFAISSSLGLLTSALRSTLVELRIKSCHLPSFETVKELICSFDVLEKLYVIGTWDGRYPPSAAAAVDDQEEKVEVYRPSKRLREVELYCKTEDVLQWFLELDPVHVVSKLTLRNIIEAELPDVGRYLDAVGGDLTDLTMEPGTETDTETICQHIDLSKNPRLRSIHLNLKRWDPNRYLAVVSGVLAQIRNGGSSDLSRVELILHPKFYQKIGESEVIQLDALLADHPDLKKVVVQVIGTPSTQAIEALEYMFMRCYALGMLECSVIEMEGV